MEFLIDMLTDNDIEQSLINKEFYDKTGIYSEEGKYLVDVGEDSPREIGDMKNVRKYLKMCLNNVTWQE